MKTPRTKWILRKKRVKAVSAQLVRSARGVKQPPLKTPWLADAEDLLNAVVSFVWRAGGSLAFGFAALFREQPTKRLLALEAEGRVLSWATLLVASSAIFSALWPAAFNMESASPSAWVFAALKLPNVSDYIERFLPTLGVGLLACLFASVPSIANGGKAAFQGPRLLTSTLFSLSLVVSLMAAAVFSYVVLEGNAQFALKWLEPWMGKIAAETAILIGSIGVLVLPVCLASSFAVGRACLGAPMTKLRPVVRSEIRSVVAILAGICASFVPIAMFAASTYSVATLGPITATFKDSGTPEEMAEFSALEPRCALNSDDKANPKIECILTARTSGKGYVLLDFASPALVLTGEQLGASRSEKRRLSKENGIRENANLESRDQDITTVAAGPAWSLSFAAPTAPVKNGDVISLELGKPLIATLRINVPIACKDELLSYYLGERGLYHFLYLRARPIRETPVPEGSDFAAVGPWSLPLEAFNKTCSAKR